VTGPSRQFDTRSEPFLGRLHAVPDDYFDEPVAATYDESLTAMFDDAVIEPAVAFLAVLAGDGPAFELGIGPGRIGPPLSRRSVAVHGIDLSAAMVARLRAKPGGDDIEVTICDFATTRVDRTFRLAYLVFNTIMNLTSQTSRSPASPTPPPTWARRVLPYRGDGARPPAAAARRDGAPVHRQRRAARLRPVRHRQAGARLPPLPARRGPAGTLVGPRSVEMMRTLEFPAWPTPASRTSFATMTRSLLLAQHANGSYR